MEKDPEFYRDDGDLSIQVEQTLFRVSAILFAILFAPLWHRTLLTARLVK
jgi:hypothetical protein